MKKYLPIVNLVLLIIIFCYCFYIFSKVSVLSAEIETVKNSTSVQSQVGMDWILGLIDSNFSTVITFVTVLFSMLGLITFVGIREQFKFSIERLEKRFKKQRDESIVHIKRLESIEGDLSFEVASRNHEKLDSLFEKSEKSFEDYVRIVELSLVTCEYYSKSLLLKSDIHKKFEKSVKNIIKSILYDTSELISTQTKFELNNMGYTRFLRLQKNIELVCDKDDGQNLALIFSKLDFPDLD